MRRRTVFLCSLLACVAAAADDPTELLPLTQGAAWEYELLQAQPRGRRPRRSATLLVVVQAEERVSVQGFPTMAWRLERSYTPLGATRAERSTLWVRLVPAELSVFEALGPGSKLVKRVVRLDPQAARGRVRLAFALADLLLGPLLHNPIDRAEAHFEKVTLEARELRTPAGRFKAERYTFRQPRRALGGPHWVRDEAAVAPRVGLVEYRGEQSPGASKGPVLAPIWARLRQFRRAAPRAR